VQHLSMSHSDIVMPWNFDYGYDQMIETIGTFMNIIHTILARDWYCAEYV